MIWFPRIGVADFLQIWLNQKNKVNKQLNIYWITGIRGDGLAHFWGGAGAGRPAQPARTAIPWFAVRISQNQKCKFCFSFMIEIVPDLRNLDDFALVSR